MKLNLELLSMRFSQKETEQIVPTDGINTYLLEKVLLPAMNDGTIYLGDIDFDAFDAEDIEAVAEYHDRLTGAVQLTFQFVMAVDSTPSQASRDRMFC